MPNPPRRRHPRHPGPPPDHPDTPFRDPAEYLDALFGAIREHVAEAEETEEEPFDTDDFDYVPVHLRERQRRSAPRHAPWAPPPPCRSTTRAPQVRSTARLVRRRVAATRKADRTFAWPHQALADATGLERSLALAVVLLRGFEADRLGPHMRSQPPEPEEIGELAHRLAGTRTDARRRIVRALQADGELVRGGLVQPFGDEEHRYFRHHGPGFLLPRAVRRFIDGRPTPLEPTRVVGPGREQPHDWMSDASSDQIRTRVAGRERAQKLLAASDLPTAGARAALGPVEIAVPRGVPGAGLAGALATLLERPVIDALPRPQEPEPGRRELIAEARLRGAAVLIEVPEPAMGGPFGPFTEDPEEEAHRWPYEVLVIRLDRGEGEAGVRLTPPGPETRGRLWSRALETLQEPPLEPSILERLTAMPLHPEQIVATAAAHVISADGTPRSPGALLQTAGRALRLDGPTAEIPSIRLADVILPPELRRQAEHAIAACGDWKALAERLEGSIHGGYGRTPVLLFSGAPGTGKTRLAEAVAGEQGRALRRLSGPDLRSCWYGEAERTIRTEFRRRDDAVLFLDEVDGFLTQRGSGPQSRTDSRLANVLLEEIERTDHLVIMATNRAAQLDAALERRVLFHLKFEAPGPVQREQIWRLHLPTGIAGSEEVDCGRLARLELSGGGIKNASWRAILTAHRDGDPLTTASVEEEGRRELAGARSTRTVAGFGARGGRSRRPAEA
ncbi:MAG: AAA family ATPase [Proteobacteria bacterium]|nr:AAA family ATPase [Pseudomonadota bacterium]